MINISLGAILKIVGVLILLAFIYLIRDILLTVFVAIIFAALIEPIVNKLEEKKIPRAFGVVIIYIVLLLFLVLVARLLIPPIVDQVGLLATNFPSFWSRVMENFASVRQYSQDQGLLDSIQRSLQGLESSLTKAAGGFYVFVVAVFRNLINFVVILAITAYLVTQRDSLARVLKAIAPAKYHDYLIDLAGRIQQKIGDWGRGQLILGLIIGAMSFVPLIFLLPKYALVLAIVAGVTELIPYLGPILGAIPAVFLGFVMPPFSFWRGIAILIMYIIIQQLENNIIVPKVMKKKIGLNSAIIIIVILIGARLAGIVGIVLAIPVATAISLIVKDFTKNSDFAKISATVDQPEDFKSDKI